MVPIYFDMIKLAVPASHRGTAEDSFAQYVVFGTYDLLYYALPTTDDATGFEWLEQQHEDRHDLDWNYERHPLFACCADDMYERARDVIDHKRHHAQPLVLTMARMAKHLLPAEGLELDEVLRSLQERIDELSMGGHPLDLAVCWNLGNADFVIISRPSRLSTLRDLYLSLGRDGFRARGSAADEFQAKFMSFSSYCAFPVGSDTNERIDGDGLKKWLDTDDELEFIDFVDALPNSESIDGIGKAFGESRFLLGDRDYQLIDGVGNRTSGRMGSIARIVTQMLDPAGPSKIYNSSLIPCLPLPRRGPRDATPPTKSGAETRPYGLTWDEVESTRVALIARIEAMSSEIMGKKEDSSELRLRLAELLDHCANTLDALYKHATRLYASAYQDDVFYVVRSLYDDLANVLNTYWHFGKGNALGDSSNNIDLLAKMARSVYASSMEFVSELQHVYTVLAISPHSYMETYYGSMRSLNASSKLWVSYSGVAKALCELFPIRNEGKRQGCGVLLIPYREKPSQSEQMFPALYSTSIIVLMRLNYQMMFNTRRTLFVIAHELGHYIFNATRKERSRLMTKAVFAYVVNNKLGDALESPLFFLTAMPDSSKQAGREEYQKALRGGASARKKLCLNVLGDLDERAYEGLYQEMAGDLGHKYIDAISDAIDPQEYRRVEERASQHKDLCGAPDYYYGRDVIEAIAEQVNGRLDNIVQKVSNGVAHASVRFLRDVGAYEKKWSVRFDDYQLVRLATYWEEGGRRHDVDRLNTNQAREYLEVFQETHADVFACISIGYELKDYLEHISYFSDTSPTLLSERDNLVRVMAVCETALGDKGCRGLVEWIGDERSCPFSAKVRHQALEDVRSICGGLYYRYLAEYGDIVARSVRERVEQIDEDRSMRSLLKDIRAFARGGSEAPLPMWRFWLYVMSHS